MMFNFIQGRAQEFEGWGVAQFEAVRFPPKFKRRAKKRPTRPLMPNSPAQSRMKSKKKVITPSDCPLYVYHLYAPKVLCVYVRGRARPPLDMPLFI